MSGDPMDIDGLRELVRQGLTLNQIAVELDCSLPTVRKHIARNNILRAKVQPPGRPVSLEFLDLAELVESGYRLRELSTYYGKHRQTILNHIRKLGISYGYGKGSPGQRNGSWNGGRMQVGDYVYLKCPEHPSATKHGYVLESRLVMEKQLGRYLLPTEVVHHKVGFSNDPDNLVVYDTNADHLADTLKGKIPNWTAEGRQRILEGVRRPRGPRKSASRGQSEKRDDP